MTVTLPVPDLDAAGRTVLPYLPSAGVTVVLGLAYALVRLDRAYPALFPTAAARLWAAATSPKACVGYLTGVAAGWCRWAEYVREFRDAAGDPAALPPAADGVVPVGILSAVAGLACLARVVLGWAAAHPRPVTAAVAARLAGEWFMIHGVYAGTTAHVLPDGTTRLRCRALSNVWAVPAVTDAMGGTVVERRPTAIGVTDWVVDLPPAGVRWFLRRLVPASVNAWSRALADNYRPPDPAPEPVVEAAAPPQPKPQPVEEVKAAPPPAPSPRRSRTGPRPTWPWPSTGPTACVVRSRPPAGPTAGPT